MRDTNHLEWGEVEISREQLLTFWNSSSAMRCVSEMDLKAAFHAIGVSVEGDDF